MNQSNRWHLWYAWRPVLVHSDRKTILVFFEDILRRRVYVDGKYRWQYALIEDSAQID